MKQLLILFALFPVFLIGQNLPETIPDDNPTLQDSIRKWKKDYRVYQGHTLPADPARSKPIWKYDTTLLYRHDPFRFQRERPIRITEPRKGMMCDPGIKIVGDDGIRITDLANGMIRIEKIESEAEFWRRKYAELLKSHLELVERKIVE